MPERPRQVVRALILDETDRVLLVRFDLPEISLWATPGGGVDDGESCETALRRELAEETGLTIFELGPVIWTRSHEFTIAGRDYWHDERIYLIKTPWFSPSPHWSWSQLATEGMTDIRWWSVEEMRSAEVTFAPAGMPDLVTRLVDEGPPDIPIDAGV